MAGEVTVDLEKVAKLENPGEDPPEKKDDDVAVVIEDKAALVEAEDGIDALKAKLAKAETDTVAERARANNAEGRLAKATGDVHKSQVQTVEDAITLKTQELATLKTQMIEAQTNADWATAADLAEKVGIGAGELVQLRAGKVALESRPAPVLQHGGDPAEILAQQMDSRGYSKSAGWLRAHPEYARDQNKYRRMLAAHNLAIDDTTVDSPEYIAHIERTLGMGSDDRRAPIEANGHDNDPPEPLSVASTPVAARKSAPAAAPPSRSTNGSGSKGARTVTLTAEEAEAARMNKQTPEEYYAAKQQLIREGKITKH